MDTTWQSIPGTENPVPYRHATKSTFLKVMMGFKDFYKTQGDHDAIRDVVKNRAGDRLHLGIPHNWYLELTPSERYEKIKNVDLSGIVCCDEPLVVLGRIVVRNGDEYEGTELAVCMGNWGRIYVYDIPEDAAVLVAVDLDKLARFGLIHCESIYRTVYVPNCTTVPHTIVAGLMMCHKAEEVAAFCKQQHGTDVSLYTPGYKFLPMKLLGGFHEISKYFPFAAMDFCHVRYCYDAVTDRICCDWYAFAAIGHYAPASMFNIEHVLLIDTFGVIHTLDVSRQQIYRLADDVNMLLKAGLCKSIAFGSRFDRADVGAKRCESRVICPHVTDINKTFRSECAYENEHRWLCRPDRFRSDMRTWDEDDKEALKHVQKKIKRESDGASHIYYDSSGSDSEDSPHADDGTRRFVWPEEGIRTMHPSLKPRVPEKTLMLMTASTISLQEVEAMRTDEEATGILPVNIPQA